MCARCGLRTESQAPRISVSKGTTASEYSSSSISTLARACADLRLRYLGCDKFGVLSAHREAISPEESFVCIPVADNPGTFAIQTQREKFITINEKDGSNEVRGDSENIDFNSTFRIRIQARFKPRPKTSKEQKAAEKISRKELEDMVGRRLEDDEVKKLKRSRRDGNFHETLLDVKVKGKHDKFA